MEDGCKCYFKFSLLINGEQNLFCSHQSFWNNDYFQFLFSLLTAVAIRDSENLTSIIFQSLCSLHQEFSHNYICPLFYIVRSALLVLLLLAPCIMALWYDWSNPVSIALQWQDVLRDQQDSYSSLAHWSCARGGGTSSTFLEILFWMPKFSFLPLPAEYITYTYATEQGVLVFEVSALCKEDKVDFFFFPPALLSLFISVTVAVWMWITFWQVPSFYNFKYLELFYDIFPLNSVG